jgi:hypothetical protein
MNLLERRLMILENAREETKKIRSAFVYDHQHVCFVRVCVSHQDCIEVNLHS